MGIYVWGTGCGAAEAIENGLNPAEIEAFVESRPALKSFMGLPVISPRELAGRAYGLIIVTTRMAQEVEELCRELGIAEDRLLFIKEHSLLISRNKSLQRAEELLGPELLKALLPEQRVISVPSSLRGSALKSGSDYVRLATLELICRRVRSVPGAAAELGVYRGGFAGCINRLLPERRLYLFDTFTGFDGEEARRESEAKSCGEAFIEAHKNTSERQVLALMPHPESVILRPGLFPGSSEGLEESFCLVSLDADFRDSTLAGLRYFWPRLSPGGYLLLHDWDSPRLHGVAEALELYRQEIGVPLPGVPLPDMGGTLVMQKF